jgi:hypothetical protein
VEGFFTLKRTRFLTDLVILNDAIGVWLLSVFAVANDDSQIAEHLHRPDSRGPAHVSEISQMLNVNPPPSGLVINQSRQGQQDLELGVLHTARAVLEGIFCGVVAH